MVSVCAAAGYFSPAIDNIGGFKVYPSCKVADRLMEITEGDGLALVPKEIAVYLCGFQNAPRLIAVRRLYMDKLHGLIPELGRITRKRLLSYIGGRTRGLKVWWIMDKIDKHRITVVAFRSRHPHARLLASSLARRHFQLVTYAGYVLAVQGEGSTWQHDSCSTGLG